MSRHYIVPEGQKGKPRFYGSFLMVGNVGASPWDRDAVVRALALSARLLADLPPQRDWLDPELEAELATHLTNLNLLERE